MISKDEMLSVADETGLTPAVVEKDYVLGWMLAAIDQNTAFSNSWAFKGGTCLKKCYFETYRFSEDLDFTLKDESHLDEAFLKKQFSQIAEWLYETCGIEPYSLRRAQNGNILLYTARVDNGQIRAYKIDQINNASVVNQTFIPRYLIELSPGLTILPSQY